MDDQQCLGGGAGIYHRGQYLSKDPVGEKDAGNSWGKRLIQHCWKTQWEFVHKCKLETKLCSRSSPCISSQCRWQKSSRNIIILEVTPAFDQVPTGSVVELKVCTSIFLSTGSSFFLLQNCLYSDPRIFTRFSIVLSAIKDWSIMIPQPTHTLPTPKCRQCHGSMQWKRLLPLTSPSTKSSRVIGDSLSQGTSISSRNDLSIAASAASLGNRDKIEWTIGQIYRFDITPTNGAYILYTAIAFWFWSSVSVVFVWDVNLAMKKYKDYAVKNCTPPQRKTCSLVFPSHRVASFPSQSPCHIRTNGRVRPQPLRNLLLPQLL